MVGIVFNLGDWMSGLVSGLQNRLRGFESRIALKQNSFRGYSLIGKLTLPKGWTPGLEGVFNMIAV